jgi:hypothetical protein
VRPTRLRALAALLAVLALVAAGCRAEEPGNAGSSGCPSDIRAPGTFRDLEELLPRGLVERSPNSVDSGANCTASSLGSYTAHGITELRFAGATWDNGGGDATVVAVLATAPGQPTLDVTWVEEFYTVGAINARHTDEVTTTRPTMPGAGTVFRLETINDLSLQTIVVWPAGTYVRVVIVATNVEPNASRDEHNRRVATAVEAAAAVPVPQGGVPSPT